MIPPSLLNASLMFTLVPIWEQEPVTAPSGAVSDTANADEAAADAAAQPNARTGADADGINDQVAWRMVFKGYRLAVVPDWVAEVNPGYERCVENRSDDEADQQRQTQRLRGAAPQPSSGAQPAGSTPPASSDSPE